MPISDETKDKVRNVWSRPFAELPVAKDLPRLAKFMVISDEDGLAVPYNENHVYDLKKREGPDGTVPVDFKLFLHVRRVLLSLTLALEGPEKAAAVELALDAQTDYENFFLPEVLTAFLGAHLGDDNNPVIKVLKCCNQSAIAPALIELKFGLGVENTTKDVSNSWRLIVIISADKVRAMNQKRELCISGRFELEWELSVCMERPSMDRLEDIYLKVVDLSFNYSKQTPKRVQETRNLLKKYCNAEFWQQTASKSLCMMQEDPNAVHLAATPPLLDGEKVMSRYSGVGFVHVQLPFTQTTEGTLCITSYCIYFQSRDPSAMFHYQVPLMDIERVIVKRKEKREVDIVCKSVRSLRFVFQSKDFKAFGKNIAVALPSNVPRIFAMRYGRASQLNQDLSECTSKAILANGWRLYNAENESERMAVDPSLWRLSTINRHFQLCESYPHTLIVPAAVGDADLLVSAHKRLGGRIPALAWQHKDYGFLCHGARPQMAKSGDMSMPGSDESWNENVLLGMIRNCSRDSNSDAQLSSRDERVERLTTIQAKLKKLKPLRRSTNVGIRTGTEEACDFYIIDIFKRSDSGKTREVDNLLHKEVPHLAIGRDALFLEPHAEVKESYRKLHKLCSTAPSANTEEHWLLAVDGTRWLEQLRTLIQCVCRLVEVMTRGSSVFLTYHEDWDRACQLSSLAQLCMDPYYRTLEGFIVLIEKEWLSFGHPFSDRSGCLVHEESVEQVPMCLQFLDCVWQILQQFPTFFEFNSSFLVTIAEELFNGLYGTFICNNDAARRAHLIRLNTESLWTGLLKQRHRYVDPMYVAHMSPIMPSFSGRVINLWTGFFLRWYEGDSVTQLPRASHGAFGHDILTSTLCMRTTRWSDMKTYIQSLELARNAIEEELERRMIEFQAMPPPDKQARLPPISLRGSDDSDMVKSASTSQLLPVEETKKAKGGFTVISANEPRPRSSRKKKSKRTKSMGGLPRETLSGLRNLVSAKEEKSSPSSASSTPTRAISAVRAASVDLEPPVLVQEKPAVAVTAAIPAEQVDELLDMVAREASNSRSTPPSPRLSGTTEEAMVLPTEPAPAPPTDVAPPPPTEALQPQPDEQAAVEESPEEGEAGSDNADDGDDGNHEGDDVEEADEAGEEEEE